MKIPVFVLCASGFAALSFAAEETAVTPTFESVGLFKNGLAVVRATFPVKGPGCYRWDKVPRVVHGSFWVESDGKITVQSTTRMVEDTEANEPPTGALQADLAGKMVTVTLKTTGTSQTPSAITGKVWDMPPGSPSRKWDTDYSSLNPGGRPYYWYRSQVATAAAPPATASTGGFLILQDDDGTRRYIDQSAISSISVTGPFTQPKHREERPVLLFDVQNVPSNGAMVRVTYLTKGLAWLPSYQVDLSNPATLKIRQNAVVRNESGDLENTEIQLISGYPNVRFGAVDSPLWPGTGLAAFFQQVNQSASFSGGLLGNNITSQAVYMNSAGRGESQALPDVSELGNVSDDIHYESIGKHSLKAGDSMSLDIASAEAAYERVVEWVVPDPREPNGRYLPANGNEPLRDDQPWDAVRYANPFKFPMTTASAIITEGGKFRGQSQSGWVNPGQRTSLRITRALSVRTESSETEEEGQRELLRIGGNDYQRTKVKGHLVIQNFRNTDTTLAIRCEFSGELLDADGNPDKSLRPEGVASVNPRRQLDWTIKLPPGQEKMLNYRYQVLVHR